MGRERKVILALRNRIPAFKCIPGCHDCCGPIPFSKWEWEQVKDKRRATAIDCPYIGKDGCDIYKHRPIICRLFGTTPRLQCPYGCAPERMLTDEEA